MHQQCVSLIAVITVLRLVIVVLFASSLGVESVSVLNCGNGLRVAQLELGQMSNFQYVLDNGEIAVSIDAAWDLPRLRKYVDSQGLRLIGGLYTHGHFDHTGGQAPGRGQQIEGARELQKGAGQEKFKLWIGAGDMDMASLQTGLRAESWTSVKENEQLNILGNNVQIDVIETPGHSPGGVTYWVRSLQPTDKCSGGLLFTGDTVFTTNVGRTDLPGSDLEALLRSLSRLSALPGTAVVLSGHSYDAPPKRSTWEHVTKANSWIQHGIRKFPLEAQRSLPLLRSAKKDDL